MSSGVEVDFLPVGSNSKSGDCIVMRWGTPANYNLMVVDGGNLEAGQNAVDHIKTHYGENAFITHMVCTHPDNDHASGLRVILENFKVGFLWVHQPWKHAGNTLLAFHPNWTLGGLEKEIKASFSIIDELCTLAESKGTMVLEPFQGMPIGPFVVLAPSLGRYQTLLPDMSKTPATRAAEASSGFLAAIRGVTAGIVESVYNGFESFDFETLKDPETGATSASNESSVVLWGRFEDPFGEQNTVLLTGDAGVGALAEAGQYAINAGHDIKHPTLIQVPHHGARRNIGPTILNVYLGDKTNIQRGYAVVSASKKDPDHPRRKVLNAFLRRGYNWATTENGLVSFVCGFQFKGGINPVERKSIFSSVEE